MKPISYSSKNISKKNTYYTWRYRLVFAGVILIFLALFGRMVDLMVIDQRFLQKQGDARALRVVPIPAYRGMITDRNGQPLAVSTPVDAIWVNPKSFEATPLQLKNLAQLLQLPASHLQKLIDQNNQREFLYLKRQVQPDVTDAIQALGIPGVFSKREYRRYYPEAEVTAHVVGFTNIDDNGQEGMELALNKTLAGEPGLRKVVKDRLGNIVENVELMREPKPGQNVQLSIDLRIQYFAYRYLKAAVQKYAAAGGSVVVLDTQTGEILAMANLPSYNPNQRPDDNDGRYRNRAVTDLLEPGSTIKPFAVTVGLESGHYTPTTLIQTNPGWITVKGHVVRDTHPHGLITVSEVLKYSSNVGVSKIIRSVEPADSLWKLLNQIGFGMPTDSGFPGEVAGELPNYRHWDPFVLSTFSFGYGLSATTLQLARAYAVFANRGIEKPVSLLKLNTMPAGRQVIDPKVANEIVTMLETVVEPGGTATPAQVKGYWVAGKTGTSRIVGPSGYEANRHNGVFVGFAPATKPRLVMAVYIHDPRKNGYYAGYTAGPVFSKIMTDSLRLLNVPPDHLDALTPANEARAKQLDKKALSDDEG